MDLNSISSNLLLIGFALVSICCLYLLYSNFSKVREIDELKRKVEDLKNIFFNQQKHNDETYTKMITMIEHKLQIDMPNNALLTNSMTGLGNVNQTNANDANNNIANEMMAEINKTKIIN